MDILDRLTTEHRNVEKLLNQLKDSEPGDQRAELIATLKDALTVHMEVEEQYLYPIVKDVMDAETEHEGENEHQLAREGLEKLEELKDEPGFAAAVDMAEAGIGHHVEDEEDEIFPTLRAEASDRVRELDPDQLEAEVRGGAAGGSDEVIDLSREELYRRAQEADIPGRSSMTKEELAEALAE